MAERAAILKQYDYKANAGLVLAPNRDGRIREEATGAPESLWGRMTDTRMGDRVRRDRPDELPEMLKKLKERKRQKGEPKAHRETYEGTVITATAGGVEDSAVYRPRSRETRAAFDELLTFVQNRLGAQPQDVLKSAAYEVLAILKDDSKTDHLRKDDIEPMIGIMDKGVYHSLVDMGKKITDYSVDDSNDLEEGDKLDDEHGVAVVFDDDDDDADGEDMFIRGDSDDEDEEGIEAEMAPALATGMEDEMMDDEKIDKDRIDPVSIDAFWLQRKISEFVSDEHEARKLAGNVLDILGESDLRSCENMLVDLLDYDRFDFIKLLLKNRASIYFVTRLKQAQDDEARNAIEAEMEMDEGGQEALQALKYMQSGADRRKDFELKMRQETRALRKSTMTAEGDAAAGSTAISANVVDLDALIFDNGGHFMSNKRCELPEGSTRVQHKGYEEVFVPAPKNPAFGAGERLIPISELPEWSHVAFTSTMKTLNRVQSRLCDTALSSDHNLLLASPTGSGKTNVAMLCMLREIGKHFNAKGEVDLDAFKIIYIAPMKSLVAEMVNNFGLRLKSYGISVRELTGDMSLTRQQIAETQVIICTPEKWDIITRKAGDRTFTQYVRLVIIDEIHLLHDTRGPVLESIVARTTRHVEMTKQPVRLVALSATLPNYEDVAAFMHVDPEKGIFFFNNSYRPAPLAQQFIGITEKKALKRFQLMNEITFDKVMDYAGKEQVLIFVHSRKETAKTARFLRDEAIARDTLGRFLSEGSASREILRTVAEGGEVKNDDLLDLLPYGFAIHHAGMIRADRTLVEDLFADKHVQVLVSTSTLAWGVNLPAHTVIIKGTQLYDPQQGKWIELGFLDIMQMLGRAGRPQHDKTGEGIVITQHNELQFYLSVMNQQLPVESQFMSKLADNLNAEVVLGTVRNLQDGVEWMAYTYLYVRMLCSPELYGISEDDVKEDPTLLQRRRDLIHSAALILDRTGLIRYDRRTGAFQVTDLGRVASYYYVSHTSVATYNEHMKPTMSDIDVYRLFALSEEFKFISVRDEEKLEVQKLLERVPIPVKEAPDEPSAKVNVLLQAYISRLPLNGFALLSDMVYVTQSASRLLRALHEISLRRGWAQLTDKLLTLAKMVDRRMWSTQCPLRQFKNIPEDVIKRIEKKDFPWERFFDLTSHEIGELIRFEKLGKTIHKMVHQFPRLDLRAHVQPVTRSMLRIELTITPDFMFDEKIHGSVEPFWILVEDTDSENILHSEFFALKKRYAKEEHVLTFTVPIFEPLPPQYFIRVVSDRWLHCQTLLPVSFRHLMLPDKFPPLTELLDLQPLPVSDLKVPEHIELFKDHSQYFNPIQTQAYTTLHDTDENVLMCAPAGSGLLACAEFALLRAFTKDDNALCVYVNPVPELCNERFHDWSDKFAKLGKSVVQMTGSAIADSKLLNGANLVLATADQWDAVSRRWKMKRSQVSSVSLCIFDELHLLGGSKGPVLEVAVSRMRFISSQQPESPIRIVGLGGSIANAKDVGDWIGASSHGLFAFHPNVRPVPLEIHIHGLEQADFIARFLAMARPTYINICNHAETKPVVIFTTSRKQAKMVAADMVAMAAADGTPTKFLRCEPNDIAPHADALQSRALAECARAGVVFLHDGLDARDRVAVQRIFGAGAAQVMVCDAESVWSLKHNAHLVIIMGTERYDGRTHSYVDFPVADILQMMGHACRPRHDDSGKCVIFCYGARKEFFKKFLYEPLPVESHLDHFFADHLNAEIVTRTIENKQDAVDYLTWSFYYRRLAQNPNYYNLQGITHRHISDALSELVEATVKDLEESLCISVEDDMDVSSRNLGMIAAYYYLQYTTLELSAGSLNAKTRLRGMLEIVSAASEFEEITVREGEDSYLHKLAGRVQLPVPGDDVSRFLETSTKINLLLQAHFSRHPLGMNQRVDLHKILGDAPKLLLAAVDVISSNGWLRPALAAMEMSQMIVQACWNRDPVLWQLPHFSKPVIARCEEAGVKSVYDVMELEDDQRNELLQMTPQQIADVAVYCNRYPSIDVTYSLESDAVSAGDSVVLHVELEREVDEEEAAAGVGPVIAPFFPGVKDEGWWLVLGNVATNQLLCIKRVALQIHAKARLEFEAPASGSQDLTLFFMCDSYLGCDQEHEIKLNVGEKMSDE